MADATDLKLRFLRFLHFSKSIKSNPIYLDKLAKFGNFDCSSEGEQKGAHSCTNLAHRRNGLRLPKTGETVFPDFVQEFLAHDCGIAERWRGFHCGYAIVLNDAHHNSNRY